MEKKFVTWQTQRIRLCNIQNQTLQIIRKYDRQKKMLAFEA